MCIGNVCICEAYICIHIYIYICMCYIFDLLAESKTCPKIFHWTHSWHRRPHPHISWEPETFHCGNVAVVAIIFHFWLLDLCLSLLSDPKDSGELLQSFTTCAQQVPSPELSSSSGELEKFHWPTTLVDYYHLAESDTRGSSGVWYPVTQQPKQQKK